MIFKPLKNWSHEGGCTTTPKCCGLESGASEINIVQEVFSSKSFLLPSLPRGLRKWCGGGKRHKKRKESEYLRAYSPAADVFSILTPALQGRRYPV